MIVTVLALNYLVDASAQDFTVAMGFCTCRHHLVGVIVRKSDGAIIEAQEILFPEDVATFVVLATAGAGGEINRGEAVRLTMDATELFGDLVGWDIPTTSPLASQLKALAASCVNGNDMSHGHHGAAHPIQH